MTEFEKYLNALKTSPDYHRVRDAVESMLAAGDEKYISAMERDIRQAFRAWTRELESGQGGLAAVRFYWAGAETDPWVPSTVWADGLGALELVGGHLREKESVFREKGGFELGIMDDFLLELAEDEEIQDLELFDDLKWTFVHKTFEQCTQALERAMNSEEFEELKPRIRENFRFLATGGHDEDTVVLLEVH